MHSRRAPGPGRAPHTTRFASSRVRFVNPFRPVGFFVSSTVVGPYRYGRARPLPFILAAAVLVAASLAIAPLLAPELFLLAFAGMAFVTLGIASLFARRSASTTAQVNPARATVGDEAPAPKVDLTEKPGTPTDTLRTELADDSIRVTGSNLVDEDETLLSLEATATTDPAELDAAAYAAVFTPAAAAAAASEASEHSSRSASRASGRSSVASTDSAKPAAPAEAAPEAPEAAATKAETTVKGRKSSHI